MARFERGSGVLLHPTALPGPYGIGSFGSEAVDFLDFLADAGQKYWQICPLVPTGYGDSPYQGLSARAGNTNLIDPAELVDVGLLRAEELLPLKSFAPDHVDFGKLIPEKNSVLHTAWRRFRKGEGPAVWHDETDEFRRQNAPWLDDYALFRVIKDKHEGAPWDNWDDSYRFRDASALAALKNESADQIDFHIFLQSLFFRQWQSIKTAAAQRGIRIIGDLPIFVSYDSADCWARPELFELDEERRPTRVAGVPPDYFSKTGQLWGNPLYDWGRMAENGYAWWIDVLRSQLARYDILRIDHFRGFSAFWSVPSREKTAANGAWIPAPGSDLFSRVREEIGELPIIAEDLGVITDDVRELIAECGFPGMKVLQFAFDSGEENDYLPHTYEKHSVVYTGTHDNDTTAGWYATAAKADRENFRRYTAYDGWDVPGAFVRTAMASVADLSIVPLQDLFGLGGEARFNTPGTLGPENWSWRVDPHLLTADAAARFRSVTALYGRI